MPAMSPTMTEGNIASWKVKEGGQKQLARHRNIVGEYLLSSFDAGDSFATGDVLLEIETDKAQMDVEAQDDGKLARVIQQNGAKAVKVGTRIAVLAETNDDLATLELPVEKPPPSSSHQEDQKSGADTSKSHESQSEISPTSKSEAKTPMQPSKESSSSRLSGIAQKQAYPLFPSVAQLLHEKRIPASDADNIPATGPKGRLLKGDVLAYLGSIPASYSSEQSARISKLGHLDLSNIQSAPPKEAPLPPTKQSPAVTPQTDHIHSEIAVPISLSSVLSVQKRIQATLGVTLSLSTFIARATELANDELPPSAATKPTVDELFNDVLGLDKVHKGISVGHFVPQITALPGKPFTEPRAPKNQTDIYDDLTGKTVSQNKRAVTPPPAGIATESEDGKVLNVFSVTAGKGDEKRARVFLERVKTILQVEPGRLIL